MHFAKCENDGQSSHDCHDSNIDTDGNYNYLRKKECLLQQLKQ